MNAPQTPLQESSVKIIAGYALQQKLGSGSFATVYKGIKIPGDENDSDADTVAIKVITRMSEKLTKKVLENLEMEIQILRTYQHPNIVCLQGVHKTDRHFYLILEYCGGGDLQRLIRTRKSGRLTERLTRRLMRDLSSGLKFLWGQELIHRDIKPQNLLLTGSIPFDELNDPAQLGMPEEAKQTSISSPPHFSLKIADFGFARHLQTASLAETLCGSPLYMAPEILQHHRYDAKADLWSVGTVLFEMISGRPPFNGENHIDLLRNIQRKAVRLPADVRVSKECVNLLRILLNRNPLSRAGFKEFFEACDAFVALGCEGIATLASSGSTQPRKKMDLGTIHEGDLTMTHGTDSIMTTATAAQTSSSIPLPHHPHRMSPPASHQQIYTSKSGGTIGFVTPPFGPLPTPANQMVGHPAESKLTSARAQGQPRFAPLQPSPPPFLSPIVQSSRLVTPHLSNVPANAVGPSPMLSISSRQQQGQSQLDNTGQSSQNSSDDSGFVMVNRSETLSPAPCAVLSTSSSGQGIANQYNRRSEGITRLAPSPPPSPRYFNSSQQQHISARGDYSFVNDVRTYQVPKGILSTSPGTGGALVGMMGGRARLLPQFSCDSLGQGRLDSQITTTAKMVAAGEDVGRRSITVAHLGDTRAYWAMKLVVGGGDESSLLSTALMEGVEEGFSDEHSSADVTDCDESGSTEIAGGRNRSVSIADRSMPDPNQEDENEEMPFAMPSPKNETPVVTIPTRSNSSSNFYKANSLAQSKGASKPSPELIRVHFSEALSCYLKALSMLKGVLCAVQRVKTDLEMMVSGVMTAEQRATVQNLVRRCDVTSTWLSRQFASVLERADAANVEINKILASSTLQGEEAFLPTASVEELIFSHSLACGRDAAVKQLLGQYDAARSCYRSAGLLVETLLMEPSVGADDRNVLEGYVDGFAARIKEVDDIMLQQSRSMGSSPGSSISRRGSTVIGLIGGITPPKNAGFDPVSAAFRFSATNP